MLRVTTNGQGTGGPPATTRRRHRKSAVRLAWRPRRATRLALAGIRHHRRRLDRTPLPSIIVTMHGDAREVGEALAARHEKFKLSGASNVEVVRAGLRFFGVHEIAPRARMALALAAQADAMGHSHPYHNAGHLREVTVNMANLASLNATRHTGVLLSRNDLTLALALAVSHDLRHDGATNDVPVRDAAGHPVVGADGKPVMKNVPFLLEDKSIAAIMIAGRRAGVPEADLQRMRAAVLITDPNTGYHTLDAVLDPHSDPAASAQLFGLRPELALLRDPATLRLAEMLRDADLLGSCGTSAAENDRETARLERERGMPSGGLHGRGTEYFLGTIARGKFLSPEGQFFQPNLEHIRGLNDARLQTADPEALMLADIEKQQG